MTDNGKGRDFILTTLLYVLGMTVFALVSAYAVLNYGDDFVEWTINVADRIVEAL